MDNDDTTEKESPCLLDEESWKAELILEQDENSSEPTLFNDLNCSE